MPAITSRIAWMMRPSSEPPPLELDVLACTTMRRVPFSRRIWFGPSSSTTSAKVRSGTRPLGVSTSMLASASVVRSASDRRSTTSKRFWPSTTWLSTLPLLSFSSASVSVAGVTPYSAARS